MELPSDLVILILEGDIVQILGAREDMLSTPKYNV